MAVAAPVRLRRKDTTGRAQRRVSSTARARRPDLTHYYDSRLPSVAAGEFEFTLDVVRAGKITLRLDHALESFEWIDDESMLTGNLQLRRPDPEDRKSLDLRRGDIVRCRVKWGERWYEVWEMRAAAPEVTVEEGRLSVDLKDDLAAVRSGKRRYVYRRTKRRRHGWFGHDILRDAARREGIRLGALAKCTTRMPKVDVRTSFLGLAEKVYEREASKTGRRFVLRWRNGKFEAVPYKRNTTIYVLAEQLRTATVAYEPKVENPVTVLLGKARVGKGKAAKKIRHTEYRREMVERFGRVEKEKDYGRVDSAADLRKQMKLDLAKQYKVDTTITVQHAGIPFIRRGDGVQCVLASEELTGERSFVYTTRGQHQVQGATYTSEWTMIRDDPFEADRERQEKLARERARRARSRRRRGSH